LNFDDCSQLFKTDCTASCGRFLRVHCRTRKSPPLRFITGFIALYRTDGRKMPKSALHDQIPRPRQYSAPTTLLPTPPRTPHKRRCTRSKGLTNGDGGGDSGRLAGTGRRTMYNGNEDEDALWLGMASSKVGSTNAQVRVSSRPPSASVSPAPLLYLRCQNRTVPVTPPPTRLTSTTTIVSESLQENPRADSPQVQPELRHATRDSPSNPFLASPGDLTCNDSARMSISASPSQRTSVREGPTITYVLYVPVVSDGTSTNTNYVSAVG
jgi:hypothetical protein